MKRLWGLSPPTPLMMRDCVLQAWNPATDAQAGLVSRSRNVADVLWRIAWLVCPVKQQQSDAGRSSDSQ